MEVRKTTFAGSWYPGDARQCKQAIEEFLAEGIDPAISGQQWIGGIVPHAGWYFSGGIACRVISCLKNKAPVDLVVVFGMHLPPGAASYMMPKGAWETPFGELPVAEPLAEVLTRQFRFEIETPRRFHQDNTIELQMPFVHYLLQPSHVLAIGVPPVAQSLDIGRAVVDWARKNDKRMKIIGSTDLTHYGPNYGFSPQGLGAQAVDWVRDHNDKSVIAAMLDLDPERVIQEGLQHQNACCAGAAATAIAAAKHMGAVKADQVAYGTSHEKSPGQSFVGYAGVVFGPS